MTTFPQQRWEMRERRVYLALSSKLSHPQSSVHHRGIRGTSKPAATMVGCRTRRGGAGGRRASGVGFSGGLLKPQAGVLMGIRPVHRGWGDINSWGPS